MAGGNKILTSLLFNIEANSAELKKGIEQANKHIKGFQSQVSKIGNMIKGAFAFTAVITAAKKALDFSKEASEAAAQAEGVKKAFADMNQPNLLNEMRTAVKGTVSDLELMKAAVKANEFNIPVEKMGIMMQFAAMQANKMGESVDYMVQSITTGLARGSVMILDNLGLSAKELNETAAKTGDITSAAFEVMNKKMQETGGLLETTATKQARFKAQIENTKIAFGDLVNKGINAVTPALMDVYDAVAGFFKKAKAYIVDFINGWIELYNESVAFRVVIEYIKFGFKSTFEAVKLMLKNLVDSFKNTGKIIGYVLNPKNWGAGFGDGLKALMTEAQDDLKENFVDFGKNSWDNFKKGLENVKKGKIKLIGEEEAEEAGIAAAEPFKKGLVQALESGVGQKREIALPIRIDTSNIAMPSVAPDVAAIAENLAVKQGTVNESVQESIDLYNELGNYFSDLVNLGGEIGNVIGAVFGEKAQENVKAFMEGFQNFIGVLQSMMNVFQLINNIISTFKTITDASVASTQALTAAKQGENAATLAGAAASTSEATAEGMNAAASAGKSAAQTPVIGAILAVAAIAAVVASILSMRKKLKGNAMGGTGFGGELRMVGEEGAELISLPSGGRVYSAGRTNQLLNNYQPALQPVVLDTRLAGGDIWLTQRDYNKRISNTR